MNTSKDDPRDTLHGVVRYRLEQEHPVMAAMATQIEVGRRTGRAGTCGECVFRVVFDGPALPEKQTFEGVIPAGDERFEEVATLLRECERQVAEAIRRAR